MCSDEIMIKCPLYPWHCDGGKDDCNIKSDIGVKVKMENKEEIKTEENKKGAKDYSLFAQIISAVWIAGWNCAQFIKMLSIGGHIEVMEIVTSGLAIAGCFAPVYVSIIFDKIKEIKNLK